MTDPDEAWLSQQVVDTAQAMSALGLSPQKSGNVSVRAGAGMLITPSGLAYASLLPGDIVQVAMEGTAKAGERKPSTEAPMHLAIYRDRPEAHAIVHCHSLAATAFSSTRKAIPAFHYMVAIAGGKDVACAAYAAVGSDKLARNAVKALKNRRACLLANHGQIAFGATLSEALVLAEQVELLARMYVDAMQAGKPAILSDAEMRRMLVKFEDYGRG